MDDQTKNLILATALSFLVIVVWSLFFAPEPPIQDPATVAQNEQTATGDLATAPPVSGDTSGTAVPTLDGEPLPTRDSALAQTARVDVESDRVVGSISLLGGRIDDLKLKDYKVSLDEGSDIVTVLSPVGTDHPYYALYGWAPTRDGNVGFDALPGAKTPWAVESGTKLTPTTPITLKWDNGAGLVFRRTISLDEDFLFNITQSVENTTSGDISIAPYGIIAQQGEPDLIGFYILHEGVVRSVDGITSETDYDDLADMDIDANERAAVERENVTDRGWIGFTGKEWMTTLIPSAGQPFTSVAKYTAANDTYQTDMRLPKMTVAAGATAQMQTSLFAGAKEWEVLKKYEDNFEVDRLTDSIDWGWFFYITRSSAIWGGRSSR